MLFGALCSISRVRFGNGKRTEQNLLAPKENEMVRREERRSRRKATFLFAFTLLPATGTSSLDDDNESCAAG